MDSMLKSVYKVETNCRACGNESLTDILEFGPTALADRIVKKEDLDKEEIRVPLTLAHCSNCSLVQILESVDPEVLFFSEYPYFSSVSPSLMEHFGKSAAHILATKKLDENSLVVEAASNDGYLLRHFKAAGIPVLGIDPAAAPAAKANELGIHTLNTFFTSSLARQLVDEGKKADVFLANNVIAHVPDLNGFMDGVATILKDDGLAVMEIHYVVSLVDHCEFDTIYHQHMCYHTVTALDKLIRSHGMYLNDVVRTEIHGGSLRIFVGKQETVSDNVAELMAMEKERGLLSGEYFKEFSSRVTNLKTKLIAILDDLKSKGKSIAGYGAAAKANTLLAFCGIGTNYLDFIADLNPYKQGKYMSGNKLPILPPATVLENRPDYVLILAWNFAEEIMRHQSEYARIGGKFIVPVPHPQIHEPQ
jgi:SAM-dependent methyltransferase